MTCFKKHTRVIELTAREQKLFKVSGLHYSISFKLVHAKN